MNSNESNIINIEELQKEGNAMEPVRTIYGDVNNCIDILNGITFQGTDEVVRIGIPVARVVGMLRDCVAAWDREAAAEEAAKAAAASMEKEPEPDPGMETVETGIDGGNENGAETNPE